MWQTDADWHELMAAPPSRRLERARIHPSLTWMSKQRVLRVLLTKDLEVTGTKAVVRAPARAEKVPYKLQDMQNMSSTVSERCGEMRHECTWTRIWLGYGAVCQHEIFRLYQIHINCDTWTVLDDISGPGRAPETPLTYTASSRGVAYYSQKP